MSLLSEAMESCVILDKQTRPDGVGGVITTWVEGSAFDAAFDFNTSLEARVAEQNGVKSLYTVTTRKDVLMRYHDAFKRIRDGKVFRVTSDGDDKFTPQSSALNMRQVTAEEWVIK